MKAQKLTRRLGRALLALGASAAAVAGAVFASTIPAGAADLPQVTFSATGATFDLTSGSTPFGFWIWCDAGSGSSYGDCSGSMYFYKLSPNSVPVSGKITALDTATGSYQMTVSSSNNDISCTLANRPPVVNGPANQVTATCTNPAGSGTVTNAVVAVSATP